MDFWTDAISNSGFFDPRYTCDVDNSSPELRWRNPPPGTQSYAVIFEDLDAESFKHWVVYNIPTSVFHLPTGIPPQDTLPNGIRQGVNSYGKLGYAGPCPPMRASAHHYRMRLFALNSVPDLGARLTGDQLLLEIRPYVIDSVEISARYARQIERAG